MGSPQESVFDVLGRQEIANIVEEMYVGEPLKIALFGSPDARELSLIENKEDLIVSCFDQVAGEEPDEFLDFHFEHINVFDKNFSEIEQQDLVINRWFLHHCTTEQKRQFLSSAKEISNNILTIDWFIPDWNNVEEYYMGLGEYYCHHTFYGISPGPDKTKWLNRARGSEIADSNGGKFTSMRRIEEEFVNLGLVFTKKYLCPPEIANAELLGQVCYLSATTFIL